jgi:hypothetical protein
MRAVRLFAQLTIYYLALAAITYVVLNVFPEYRDYLPIGGAEQLISQAGKGSALDSVTQSAEVRSLGESLGWMATAIFGALLAALPVSWVYMGTRTTEEYDQSLISSILILPVVVTSIVVVVQHSLSLAFALGGIAGAVRFKNSLKSSGDALYILLTVGIGLSSGIGAVELALLMTVAFNYCFVVLWTTEYGERAGMKRYMSDFEADGAAPATPTADITPEPPLAPPPA